MSANLSPLLRQRFFDLNGDPLVGGKLYSYIAGSTTPVATYTDELGIALNTNPIILNANGECDMWLKDQMYKFVLKDANDVVQWTVDSVRGASGNGSTQSSTRVIGSSPWHSPKVDGAVLAEEFGSEVFKFSKDALQKITRILPIPETYNGGAITARLKAYSPTVRASSLSDPDPSINIQLKATLLKQSLGAGDTSKQNLSSTQFFLEGGEFIPPSSWSVGTPNKIYELAFNISTNGQIGGSAIEKTKDLLLLEIQRIAIDPSLVNTVSGRTGFEDTDDARIYKNIIEVNFL